jgi:tRNA (cytosine38-C5)-methyltransferase
MRIVECFSGIGGMHYAAECVGNHEVVAAIDINTTANQVYQFNHTGTLLLQRNIQTISVDTLLALQADMYLMSPPCQPYTRTGKQLGSLDERARAFIQFFETVTRHVQPTHLLIENVKGFEASDTHQHVMDCLSDYNVQQFLLSPLQFGLPNSRTRYYLLAKKKPLTFQLESRGIQDWLMDSPPLHELHADSTLHLDTIQPISDFLEPPDDTFNVPPHIITKYGLLFDIVTPLSKRSCCFTKGYVHRVERTGSVLTTHTEGLRYFSPREIANLMGFPPTFSFPPSITNKQQYRLLGNSVNVVVVAALIQHLCA